MMEVRLSKITSVFFFIVLIFGSSAFANFGLGTPLVRQEIPFTTSAIMGEDEYTRSGIVTYEVYDKEAYTGAFAALIPDTHYVYAYQISNGITSNTSITSFTVNFAMGLTVENPGSEENGIDPVFIPNSSGMITYFFGSPSILPGQTSSILMFSTPFEHTNGSVGANGSYFNSVIMDIMVPTPEPSTILLLGAGLVMLKRRPKKLRITNTAIWPR